MQSPIIPARMMADGRLCVYWCHCPRPITDPCLSFLHAGLMRFTALGLDRCAGLHACMHGDDGGLAAALRLNSASVWVIV